MIRVLRRAAMHAWWTTVTRVASVKTTSRWPYSVTPPPSPATVVIGRPFIDVHAAIADLTTAIVVAVTAIARRYATNHSDQQHCAGAAHCRRLQTAAEHVFHCATSLLSARVHSSNPKGAPAGSAMTAVMPPWRSGCG